MVARKHDWHNKLSQVFQFSFCNYDKEKGETLNCTHLKYGAISIL